MPSVTKIVSPIASVSVVIPDAVSPLPPFPPMLLDSIPFELMLTEPMLLLLMPLPEFKELEKPFIPPELSPIILASAVTNARHVKSISIRRVILKEDG